MVTPLILYLMSLYKTNCPRILTPWARFPQDHSTIPTRSRPLSLPGWGAPRTGLLCPFSPWRSIKRIFPGYRPQVGKGGNNTHNSHCVPCLKFDFGVGYPGVRNTFSHMATPSSCTPGFSIKQIFPRILTPRARYPQDPSTIPTRSRPYSLPGSSVTYSCLGHQAQVSCAHFLPGAR